MNLESVDLKVHEGFMRDALSMVKIFRHLQFKSPTDPMQAKLALESDETPVGCVFVHKGQVIARGMNDTNRSLNVCLSSALVD